MIRKNGKKATPPCPCGYLGHYSGRCRCTPDQVQRYRSRISGPLLDRIDLHVEVPALRERELADAPRGELSNTVRMRVEAARQAQRDRQGLPNAMLAGGEIERHCAVEPAAQKLLRDAAAQLSLSARGFHRTLRVARTIADLCRDDRIYAAHAAEALQYR